MFSKITNALKNVLFISIFFAGAVVAPMEQAHAKEPVKKPIASPIQIIGKTADHKYNVYKLDGEVDAIRWFANGKSYNSEDLASRMEFIKKEDVDNGTYHCAFVCKDGLQNTVGLNPNFAHIFGKK